MHKHVKNIILRAVYCLIEIFHLENTAIFLPVAPKHITYTLPAFSFLKKLGDNETEEVPLPNKRD